MSYIDVESPLLPSTNSATKSLVSLVPGFLRNPRVSPFHASALTHVRGAPRRHRVFSFLFASLVGVGRAFFPLTNFDAVHHLQRLPWGRNSTRLGCIPAYDVLALGISQHGPVRMLEAVCRCYGRLLVDVNCVIDSLHLRHLHVMANFSSLLVMNNRATVVGYISKTTSSNILPSLLPSPLYS